MEKKPRIDVIRWPLGVGIPVWLARLDNDQEMNVRADRSDEALEKLLEMLKKRGKNADKHHYKVRLHEL